MRNIAFAVAVAALATPAFAGDAPSAPAAATNAAQTDAKASRVLYICDGSAMTRRGFAREFGSVEYVTAAEAAAQRGAVWTAPKCISPAEARRLKAKKQLLASAR